MLSWAKTKAEYSDYGEYRLCLLLLMVWSTLDVNSGKILQEYKLNMAQIYLPPVIIDGVVYIMNTPSDLVIMK